MNDKDGRFTRIYRTILALAVQTVAAGLGLYIMYKQLDQRSDRVWLYMTAVAMMGLPFASNFEKLVTFLNQLLNAVAQRARDELPTQDNTPPPQRRKDDP